MDRTMHNGHCTRCNTYFIGMDRAEYNWTVSRHLNEQHAGAEPNECMERI